MTFIGAVLTAGPPRRNRPGISLVASLIALFAVTQPAHAQRINLPKVAKAKWTNGITVYLMEYRRAPTISVSAIFPGGSSVEPAEKAGLADLTAELMRKGTTTRTAPQIAEEIDFLGGSLGAGAGEDNLSVGLGVLSKDIDKGLDLFADIIRSASFPAEELVRSRQLALAGLNGLKEDPESIARRLARATVFSGHPYGSEPTVSTIEAITRDDLAAFHKQVVAPDRMILIAVGDFRTAEMSKKLRDRFGEWAPSGGALPVVQPVKPGTKRLVLLDKPDATQTQVRWIRTAIPRTHPDYFAAEVAANILGGGFTSRLVEEIRVGKSLTYSIGSNFRTLQRGGTFGVSTYTKVETTGALIDATNDVLRATETKGFTTEELNRVKGYMAGLFAISVQTPEALAGQLADIAFYGLPDDYLETYIDRIRSVTLADVNRVAGTYGKPESFSLVVVGPGSKVAPQIQKYGTFKTISVEAVGKTDVSQLRPAGTSSRTLPEGGFVVNDDTKKKIDRWIKENDRNPYGDDKDTVYMGGTPLFDERTGKTKDKYEYILDRHPELRKK